MKEVNHSELLGKSLGEGGDYYIGTAAVTTKKFALIVVGPSGATVSVCKIRGVDVKTARNYGSLPAGYMMCAGGNDYFNSITFSAGSGLGIIYSEPPVVEITAASITTGDEETAITNSITFNNTGNAGSVKLDWRIKDDAGAIVVAGKADLYCLPGTGVSAAIQGLTFPAQPGTDFTFEVSLEGKEDWTVSSVFDINDVTTTAAPTTTAATTT